MFCTMEQLCQKDVIDVDTASRVGWITDLEIDMETGEIVHICVSCGGIFKNKPAVKICRKDILKIGAQTVLVKNVPPPPPPGRKPLLGFLAK